jgi:hypothetical protein
MKVGPDAEQKLIKWKIRSSNLSLLQPLIIHHHQGLQSYLTWSEINVKRVVFNLSNKKVLSY